MAQLTMTLRLLPLLLCLVAGAVPADSGPGGSTLPQGRQLADGPAEAQPGADLLSELNLLSHALIDKAASGRSPAHEFRIEARMYRELLRRLMLDDRVLPPDSQLPRDLLQEMVRMSALLHSAADCKTGMVITCPPDLMRQLQSQQARIDQGLQLRRLDPG